MSTYFPSGKGLAESRKWFVVDARGKTVGRLATEVARILSGKNNPAWTPFMDMGDHCRCYQRPARRFHGCEDDQKIYRRHTLYPGGLRETTVKEMFEKKPEKVIELAVRGMLPKTKLGKAMGKEIKGLRGWRPSPHRAEARIDREYKLIINRYGRHSVLRHRPQKDFNRTCLSSSGHGRDHGQQALILTPISLTKRCR